MHHLQQKDQKGGTKTRQSKLAVRWWCTLGIIIGLLKDN